MEVHYIDKMKTIKEHNKNFWKEHNILMETGVLCNKCKTEMIYSSITMNLTYPPSRKVHCPNCGMKDVKYQ